MQVYAKTDEQGRILAVDSGERIRDTAGWTLIGEGDNSDRFRHAQSCFFPLPLRSPNGVSRYRLENGRAVARPAAEIEAEAAEREAARPDTESKLMDAVRGLPEITWQLLPAALRAALARYRGV